MSLRLVLPVLALALPACQSPGTLFIHGCLTPTDRATCTFAATAAAPLQRQGTIDAAYAGLYTCTALVEGMDLNGPLTLDQAEVSVSDPAQGSAPIAQFSVPITGPVEPSAPLATTDVTLLDATTMMVEAAQVVSSGRHQTLVASFIVTARTASGSIVASPPLDYPIDINYAFSCANTGGAPCVAADSTVSPDCRLGIDEPVGTSCQSIADQLGVCQFLECDVEPGTGMGDLSTAHCPTHVPVDRSCCQ